MLQVLLETIQTQYKILMQVELFLLQLLWVQVAVLQVLVEVMLQEDHQVPVQLEQLEVPEVPVQAVSAGERVAPQGPP